jgi:hypothetical protein
MAKFDQSHEYLFKFYIFFLKTNVGFETGSCIDSGSEMNTYFGSRSQSKNFWIKLDPRFVTYLLYCIVMVPDYILFFL